MPKTILAGSTFCIADERGDIDVPPAGLFAHDTRFLSRFVVLINGARPELLTGRRGDPHEASYFSRNPLAGGLERDELEIVRRRRISVGLEEQLIVRNLGSRQVELDVELELAADFADIFAVKAHDFSLGAAADTTPLPGPAPAEYDTERHILRFADTVSDLVTVITYSQPGERTDDGLRFQVSLAPHAEWELDLQFVPGLDAAEAEAAVAALPAEGRRVEASLSAWRQTVPKLTTSASLLQRSYDRAIDDLAALRLRASDNGELIAAGLPWFMTVFGRDTIIASLQTLLLGQDLARTALRELARLQATEDDASIDAEPGKIVHELRSGKGASAFFARYYGTVYATPLFLVLLSEVWRWTRDDEFARELRRARAAGTRIDLRCGRLGRRRLRRVRAPRRPRAGEPDVEGLARFAALPRRKRRRRGRSRLRRSRATSTTRSGGWQSWHETCGATKGWPIGSSARRPSYACDSTTRSGASVRAAGRMRSPSTARNGP